MKRKGVVFNKKHVQMGKYMFSQTIKQLQKEKEKLPPNSPGYRAMSDLAAGLARRRRDLKECEKIGAALL